MRYGPTDRRTDTASYRDASKKGVKWVKKNVTDADEKYSFVRQVELYPNQISIFGQEKKIWDKETFWDTQSQCVTKTKKTSSGRNKDASIGFFSEMRQMIVEMGMIWGPPESL